MANFLNGRGMTWVLLLWSGYIATWMLITGSGPTLAAGWWLAGIVGVALLAPAYRSARAGSPSPPPTSPGDADTTSSELEPSSRLCATKEPPGRQEGSSVLDLTRRDRQPRRDGRWTVQGEAQQETG